MELLLLNHEQGKRRKERSAVEYYESTKIKEIIKEIRVAKYNIHLYTIGNMKFDKPNVSILLPIEYIFLVRLEKGRELLVFDSILSNVNRP